jgi:non-heme Fe2+,alpha-ketoglutarate-dependent halogenase
MVDLLSEEAVRDYRARGFHTPIRVMDEAEALERRRWVERLEAEQPDLYRKCDLKAQMLVPWIDDLTRKPELLEPISRLLGPNLICWNASFRIKRNDGRHHAGWHQDTRYIDLQPPGVIAFVALSDCSREAGCLRAIPGTHRGPILNHQDSASADSILTRGQFITDPLDEDSAVDLALKPGEVALFDHGIVHGSGPNTSSDRRIGMILGYFAPHSRPVNGSTMSGMVVQGDDEYGFFRPDPRPSGEFADSALAAHRAAVEAQTRELLFAGSERKPIALN